MLVNLLNASMLTTGFSAVNIYFTFDKLKAKKKAPESLLICFNNFTNISLSKLMEPYLFTHV